MLLNGTEGPKMMDNLTVQKGAVLFQEDVGNQKHIGKVWRYDIKSDTVELFAQHDPDRFTPGADNFITQDEESSAIIPMDDILGHGWFLATVQAHSKLADPELVEAGQLVALHLGKSLGKWDNEAAEDEDRDHDGHGHDAGEDDDHR